MAYRSHVTNEDPEQYHATQYCFNTQWLQSDKTQDFIMIVTNFIGQRYKTLTDACLTPATLRTTCLNISTRTDKFWENEIKELLRTYRKVRDTYSAMFLLYVNCQYGANMDKKKLVIELMIPSLTSFMRHLYIAMFESDDMLQQHFSAMTFDQRMLLTISRIRLCINDFIQNHNVFQSVQVTEDMPAETYQKTFEPDPVNELQPQAVADTSSVSGMPEDAITAMMRTAIRGSVVNVPSFSAEAPVNVPSFSAEAPVAPPYTQPTPRARHSSAATSTVTLETDFLLVNKAANSEIGPEDSASEVAKRNFTRELVTQHTTQTNNDDAIDRFVNNYAET